MALGSNMNHDDKRIAEAEQELACLAPHVRQACHSVPSPTVLTAIHDAAWQKVRRNRILPFVRFAAAAAAMLVVSLAGWVLIRSSLPSETDRQAMLMDDMLFLCAEYPLPAEVAPEMKREDRARRLLNLQGLDEVETLSAETPEEPPAPPSKETQSHNTPGLRVQICG